MKTKTLRKIAPPNDDFCLIWTGVPREEGWLRHQENFGEAHLSAADGGVAHTENLLVSDHPVRSAATPPHEEGNISPRARIKSTPPTMMATSATLNTPVLNGPTPILIKSMTLPRKMRSTRFETPPANVKLAPARANP